ncbi:hypothetical protein BGZ99_001326 [Dissophora globulifera]|uniref:LIM zinc-binding domain-containing protein n=1 Tax=Dissophora globulifera TaxID=979702 RepID=A0A9P6UK95_9FUNG|nr:hypothetical protein BGZ99_001326 [Dissophora globulifera]
MGFCHRCGDLVHGANCLKCGGRSVSSVTSGLQSNSGHDPWMNAYQNILEGGMSKPSKRMSMPIVSTVTRPQQLLQLQPLVAQKHCHGCTKQIHQAKVFVEPGKPGVIYCEKCYVEKFTKGNCPSCQKPVLSKTDPYITHNRRTFHASCFKCFSCSVDLSTKPMVDLRGRPCCEKCLMAQSSLADNTTTTTTTSSMSSSPYLQHSSTSGDRSLTSSPVPGKAGSTSPLPSSTRAYRSSSNNSLADTSAELSTRLQPSLTPLDMNLDRTSLLQTNSPVSAQSVSSRTSSLSGGVDNTGSFRNSSSSGYTSGTSSVYSSMGRQHAHSITPPLEGTLSDSIANKLRAETSSGSGAASPLLSPYRRPSSALSIHSYDSSRAGSPVSGRQGQDSYSGGGTNLLKPSTTATNHEEDTDLMGREQPGIENMSEATLHSVRKSRSRSMIHMDRGGGLLGQGPVTLSRKGSSVLDDYPTSSIEADLVAPTKNLSLSGTERYQPQQQQQTTLKPTLGRARSRSSVGPAPTSATVKARKEAYMNQAQSTHSLTTPRSQSQMISQGSSNNLVANRMSTVFSHQPAKPTAPAATTSIATTSTNSEAKGSFNDNGSRPSLHRHGRQRSNTVGEAISLPTVNADNGGLSPSFQRVGAVPDGHCLKCFEKVTENGVRLQNGDRYHIGCFLCNGCKQVFTESEFHVVMGRPYHPSCVSMAGPSSSMGVVTKCQKCAKVISSKSIRFSGVNFHPQCFTCTHCNKVLSSTSRFYEVEGQVECEQCCDERDQRGNGRLPQPKIVPVPRGTDHFPLPAMAPLSPAASRRSSMPLEASHPGMMATTSTTSYGSSANLSRAGSGNGSGYGSPRSGASSPLRSPDSPGASAAAANHHSDMNGSAITSPLTTAAGSGVTSPVVVMGSPLAQRETPPALTSFFGTRTKPLPKFGGVTMCPRCQQAVGVMDQVPGPKNEKWHKKCLNCKECKKVLDSSALTRGEGEAFCRGCYNKTRTVKA